MGINPVIFLSKILPKGIFGKKIKVEHLLYTGSATKYTIRTAFSFPQRWQHRVIGTNQPVFSAFIIIQVFHKNNNQRDATNEVCNTNYFMLLLKRTIICNHVSNFLDCATSIFTRIQTPRLTDVKVQRKLALDEC